MTKITSAESEDCGNDDDEDFTLDRIVIPSSKEIRLTLFSFDRESIADVDYDTWDPDSENRRRVYQ
jgi:hypothetical protein